MLRIWLDIFQVFVCGLLCGLFYNQTGFMERTALYFNALYGTYMMMGILGGIEAVMHHAYIEGVMSNDNE